jgi:hypothetical protein
MKQLDFTYIAAQNFMCFGSEGIEIDLTKHDNMILVLGNNLDNLEMDEEGVSSNGSGKSSLAEVLVYTLFGRTIREPKKIRHEDLINNKTGKKLRTEVRWGDYRVVRTMAFVFGKAQRTFGTTAQKSLSEASPLHRSCWRKSLASTIARS